MEAQKDCLVRAISKDGFVNAVAVYTRGLTERARQIHHTSPVATAALGRALAACSMMGNALKDNGASVTMQIKGDGPLGTILTVSDSEGNVRGYVQNPAVDLALREDGKLDVGTAVGHSGTLTVIKDLNMREPYVGTVDLLGGEIAEDVAAYYVESEQVPSACGLGVLIDRDRSVLTAGGYLIQLLPGAGEDVITKVEGGIYAAPSVTNLLKENSDPAVLLKTVLSDFDMEILSVDPIEYRCYCSRERTERALLSLGSKELEKIVDEQGSAELTCQFCDRVQNFTKEDLTAMIADLKKQGITIVMVSHDVEFCARYAHRCALFFDGSIVAEGTPRDFFSGNSFYTTSANRMARDFCPRAVTPEDVIAVIGGTVPPQPEVTAAWQPLPPVAEESTAWKPKKLPWWRRAIAAVCGAGALAIFWLAAKHTDLTALVGGGTLSQAGWQALGLYGLFIALLFGCIAAIGRRSKPLTLLQTPVQKRRLSHRTRLAAALILLCIPATLYLGFFYLGNTAYYPIAFAVLLECMVPFFLVFEGRKPQARELVLVASLCALGVAGRAAFFMLPQFKPVLALTIISGVALGGETGFLVGAMTMLASNVLFSQGPWTPFQMFAMGIIGFLAGVLFRRGCAAAAPPCACSVQSPPCSSTAVS